MRTAAQFFINVHDKRRTWTLRLPVIFKKNKSKNKNTSAANRRGLLSDSKEVMFPKAKIFIVPFFFMPNCLHHQTLDVGVLKTNPGHLDLYLNSISVTFILSCSFKYHEVGFKFTSVLCAPDSYIQLPLDISVGCEGDTSHTARRIALQAASPLLSKARIFPCAPTPHLVHLPGLTVCVRPDHFHLCWLDHFSSGIRK